MQPFARRARAVSAVLMLAGVLGACAVARYEPPAQPSFYRSLTAPGTEVDSEAAASMLSGYRGNNGLGPVSVDPALTRLAKEQARAQAAKAQVGHDVGIGPLDQRARRDGYAYAEIAENVAGGYHTLAEAFSGWRDSPGHRRNMLMGGVTRIGIAVAQAPNSKYKVFWSLILAEPARRVAGAK
jgi:uncharacterized protein YkwD